MKRALVALALAGTAGCGTLGIGPAESPAGEPEDAPATVRETPSQSELDRLLDYFERVRRLPAAELAREHESARQAYVKQRSDYNRVRYAMLLMVPGPASDARVPDVLEPVVRSPRAPLRGIALLLSTLAQEQRRLESAAQSLREAAQGLQQKLDALRSLERSLSERNQGAGGRKP